MWHIVIHDRTKKYVAGKEEKESRVGLYQNVCKRRLRFLKAQNKSYVIFK